MASLRDQFGHYYAPDEDAVKTALKNGLVSPDTNVLLNLYRFQKDARHELFGALEKTGDRLWIPHQVGLEFHENRLKVIADQEEYFSNTEQDFHAVLESLHQKVRAFRARIAVNKGAIEEVEKGIQRLLALLGNIMNWASDGSLRLDDHASDEVLARVDALFPEGRVGDPMEPGELEEARKEAERRKEHKIPPGYKDRGKPDSAGDYVIWAQLKTEAGKRKLPVAFITDDTKEDFYQIYKGKTIGARRELREEMMKDAGVPVIFMTTETFLLHAQKYLNAEVSMQTVDQAKELPESLEIDERRRIVNEFVRKLKSLEIRRDAVERMHQIARMEIDNANALLADREEDVQEEARANLHAALANAEALDAEKRDLDKEILSLNTMMSQIRVAKSGVLTISDIEII